jgi:hypothetical protein
VSPLPPNDPSAPPPMAELAMAEPGRDDVLQIRISLLHNYE